jgi:hypothetical protein
MGRANLGNIDHRMGHGNNPRKEGKVVPICPDASHIIRQSARPGSRISCAGGRWVRVRLWVGGGMGGDTLASSGWNAQAEARLLSRTRAEALAGDRGRVRESFGAMTTHGRACERRCGRVTYLMILLVSPRLPRSPQLLA